jgi:leader peptidase (prepilin peptidase) / N-methyltransferase
MAQGSGLGLPGSALLHFRWPGEGGADWGFVVLVAVVGLLIGSFLNVVIHRLPKMLINAYMAYARSEVAAADGKPAPVSAEPKFNLVTPRSRCPHCGHQITWYENIPVLSWLALRGKCSACKAPIGLRYPLVELATAAWFAVCALKFGQGYSAAAWCAFGALVIAAGLVDWDTMLLPDELTLPLIAVGIAAVASRMGAMPTPVDALWGLLLGYGVLWLVYWVFKILRGVEGLAAGDFMLLGAFGLWLGWQAVVPILLVSSLAGCAVMLPQIFLKKHDKDRPFAYGPYLAAAGLVVALWGWPTVMGRIMGTVGL